jgi:hypothetical protein
LAGVYSNKNNSILEYLFTHLAPRILSPHRQSQGMSPSTVRPRIPQPLDVVEDLSAEVIFDFHLRESRSKVEDLLIRQFPDLSRWMDVKAREETGGDGGTNAKERLDGLLYIGKE